MSKQTDLINIPDAITVSGSNVGIGTSTPSAKLDIQQATAGNIISAEFDNTDYTANNRNAIKIRQQVSSSGSLSTFLGNDRNTGNVFLSNDSITANHLVIDTSGNVGIGDTSPYTWSSVQPSLNLRGTSSSFPNRSGALIFKSQSGTHMTVMDFETGNDLRWYQSSNSGSSWSERMRLDSSGNLLVGRTSLSGTDNSSGSYIYNEGAFVAQRSSDVSLYLNRFGTDGDIALFRKNGTTVGSIAANGGSIIVGSGNTGLYFDDGSDRLIPVDPATASGRDNAVNLGGGSERFKDLYLSGGVYLGGTGSANKLEDYEEGTFTPVYDNVSAPSYSNQTGKYKKIGKLVHVQVMITCSGLDTSDGSGVIITGFPFNVDTATESVVFTLGRTTAILSNQATLLRNVRAVSSGVILLKGSDDNISYNGCNSSGTLQFSCTYTTP